ncbi:glycosyltransferase family 1 protein [Candidatus Parcubacteria bacterium]|nr:MAG: glycosyltransferase family 1 protein [Candidatus Parcubacteria bacterium]
MKFCVVAYKFGTEKEIGEHLGTYHYFIEILRRLVKAGDEVTVIAPYLTLTTKGNTGFDGIKIIRYWPPLVNKIWLFPLNRIIRYLYIKQTQRVVLAQKDTDAIIVWQARETGYALCKIKEKLKPPVLFRQITTWKWHFQRSDDEIFSGKAIYNIIKALGLKNFFGIFTDRKNQQRFAKEIYAKADKVIFVSNTAAGEGIEMGLDKIKSEIIPVAIETEIFRPLNKKQELKNQLKIKAGKVLLFIGRINFAEKGIGVLLQAMPKVIAKIPDAKLVIIGAGGEEQKMKRIISDLNLAEYVLLAGKQPFTRLPEYLNASDVLIVPSLWMETFGQVTIEGMACGIPVITSDAGASPEINVDGKTGFVTPANNHEKLSESVIRILEDEVLQKNLGQQARERVIQNYSYDAVYKKLINIINNVRN